MNALLVKILADGFIIPVVLLGGWALLFLIPKGHRLESYSRILMAGLTAYLAATLIASIYQPELARPFQVLGAKAGAYYLNNPGFPSDHVLFCMAITLAVWFETRRKKIAVILLVLTALVAVGRVVALVHTPLDVFGGFVIAFAGVPWYLQRAKAVHPHTKPSTRKKLKQHVQ